MNRFLFALCFVASAFAAEQRAKNVILFLGDAAGFSTLHAASIYAYNDPQKFFIQHMANIGISDTSSAADWVSDSAAGMTAIVTGQRVRNGVLSLSASGAPLKTILEYAEEHGLSTGLITNDVITGATPAACYAHVGSRGSTADIFQQAMAPRFGNGVDIMIAAGRSASIATMQKSGIDIEAEVKKRGYTFGSDLGAVASGRAVVLLDDSEFDLQAATTAAVDALSKNPKGFFLMVECDLHTDHLLPAFERAKKFDKTIEAMTKRLRSDTLVLFTADHSFDLRISGKAVRGEPLLTVGPKGEAIPAKGVTVFGHHSAEPVLAAADGPGAQKVHGFVLNTDLFHVMMSAYGWAAE